jgi:hypothetical protein
LAPNADLKKQSLSKTMKRSPVSIPTKSSLAIAAALEKEITPAQLAAALAGGLSATVMSRNGTVEIDYRTRLQAASLVLAYQIGRPREAPLPSPPGQTEKESTESLVNDLRCSPVFRKEIRSMLDKAEGLPPSKV